MPLAFWSSRGGTSWRGAVNFALDQRKTKAMTGGGVTGFMHDQAGLLPSVSPLTTMRASTKIVDVME